ncbi:MAG: tetratricopeptide repeat protein [Deltaproteobacteria bacterium]
MSACGVRTGLVLLSLGLLVCVGRSQAADWKALNEKAENAPLAELKAAAEKDPASLDALYVLGLGYLGACDEDASRRCFEEIYRRDPKNIGGRWGRAELLRRGHELDAAEKELTAIIREAPAYAPAYITLAYLLFDNDEYERSMRLAQDVLSLPEDKVDTTNRARAYLVIGGAKGMIAEGGGPLSKLFNGTRVMAYFRKAQALQPESPGVYFGMGSFYALAPSFAGGDKKKGRALLRIAAAADPCFPDAWARLAEVSLALGDVEDYHRYLAKARSLDPRNKLVLKIEEPAQ